MYGCHDVLIMSMNLSDIVILNIDGGDYFCVITGIIKKWGHKLNGKYRFELKVKNYKI